MSNALTPAQEAARLVDSLGPEALAKAEAYTIGNHWLLFAGVGVSLLVAFIMVRSSCWIVSPRFLAMVGGSLPLS